MDKSNSKIDVEFIRINVTKLNKIVGKGEGQINKYVKDKILFALNTYTRQIEKLPTKTGTNNKTEILQLINSGIHHLEEMLTEDDDYGNERKNMDFVESLLMVELKQHQKINYGDTILQIFIYVSRIFDDLPDNQKIKELKKIISIRTLELYIKTSHATIFGEGNDSHVEDFKKSSDDDVTAATNRQINDSSTSIQGNYGAYKNNYLRNYQKGKQKSATENRKSMLSKLINFNAPKDEREEHTASTYLVLKDVEREVSSINESKMNLQEKRDALDNQATRARSVSFENNEIKDKIAMITNRIQGLIIVISRNYLKQINDTLKSCKEHVEQFAYPYRNPTYKITRKDIAAMMKKLEELTRGNKYIDRRIDHLHENIQEVLQILDQKANDNEEIIEALEVLKIVEDDINAVIESNLNVETQITKFSEFRKKLNSVGNLNTRVCTRKVKIYHKIQSCEELLYVKIDIEGLYEIKARLRKHEDEVLKLVNSISDRCNYNIYLRNEYQQKKKELTELLDDWSKGCAEEIKKKSTIDKVLKILTNNADEILKVLLQKVEEIQDTYQCLENLEIIENNVTTLGSSPQKMETLGQYKKTVKSIKRFAKESEVLNSVQNVEIKIAHEESKNALSQIEEKVDRECKLPKDLLQPISSYMYKKKIDEIMFLQDSLEDLPEEPEEMNKKKHTLLQHLHKLLLNSDEYLACMVNDKENSDNIIELQSHFNDFNPDGFGVSKESVEFVQIIRKRAESLELNVKQFLSSKNSIDFYVIHTSLMRLINELDKLNCQGDEILSKELTETTTYINQLLDLVAANAKK